MLKHVSVRATGVAYFFPYASFVLCENNAAVVTNNSLTPQHCFSMHCYERSSFFAFAIVDYDSPRVDSPDLVLSDFFLFPRMKKNLKGKRFKDVEEAKETLRVSLKGISVAVLQVERTIRETSFHDKTCQLLHRYANEGVMIVVGKLWFIFGAVFHVESTTLNTRKMVFLLATLEGYL